MSKWNDLSWVEGIRTPGLSIFFENISLAGYPTFLILFILKFFGFPINKAIGSAAAIGFIIALFGAVGFLISGSYLNVNLPLSIGFLNIPAFLIFFPITTLMARIGAKASHRIDKKKMTKYFGLFLIIIGTKFLYEYFKL